MSQWSEFYVKRVGSESYLNHFKHKYSIFLSIIDKLWTSSACEDAAGIGTVSKCINKEPSFGDERLLSPDYWLSNFKPQEHILFNDGHDLAMVWFKLR